MPNLHDLFEPRSIAVIGASADRGKIGYRLVENVLASGYPGEVYPINPRGGEVLGRRVYPTILDIEDEIDVACIAIPAASVFDAVTQCAQKGVKFVPIITSGFSEVGNLEEEKRIVAYARARTALNAHEYGKALAVSPIDQDTCANRPSCLNPSLPSTR